MLAIFTLTVLLQVCGICSGLEMPPYRVLNTAETYEERFYPAQKWVTTTYSSPYYDEAANNMFHRLFDYIDGQNDAGIKIDMTSPVTVLVQPGEGPNCESTFSESFYIPSVHQANPPRPTNPDVFIEERPPLRVFTRRFHGFAHGEDYVENARALAEDLVAAGETSINTKEYYTAGYDSPFVIFNRTNEVWIKETL